MSAVPLTPALIGGPLILGATLGFIAYAFFHPAAMLFPPTNGQQCFDNTDCYWCDTVAQEQAAWTIPPAGNCGSL